MRQLRLDSFAEAVIEFPLVPRIKAVGVGVGGDESPPVGETSQSITKKDDRSHSQRSLDEIWDACEEVLGYEPLTDTEKSGWGRCVRSLRNAGATGDDIRGMAKKYHQSWNVDLTIHAIEKWFSHFKPKQRSNRAVCSECGVGGGQHIEGCDLA